jgi:zinc transport system ATP-binding protein
MRLFDLRDRAIGELSGGQRQRIMIARALVREPKLLLLDEPTNNVDLESGRNLYELLKGLQKDITIITVSHDVDMIARQVTRVFCLNNKIVCNDAADVREVDDVQGVVHIHHKPECIIH